MSEFVLEIVTPERAFFNGNVESLTIKALDGELTVLKDHAEMIVNISIGELRFVYNGEKRNAFTTEGFLDVRKDKTIIFAQKCEWPDEIDVERALSDKEKAENMLLKKQSIREYKESLITLTRAMERLRIKNIRGSLD